MNTQLTLDQLRTMKLHGMADAYQDALTLPVHDQPTPDLLIGSMVDAELNYRKEQTMKRHLLRSKIRYPAILEQIRCSTDRNLSQQQLLTLADCRYIDRGENVMITGATGCGKSYLASASGASLLARIQHALSRHEPPDGAADSGEAGRHLYEVAEQARKDPAPDHR